ncbi:hypothetical protein [Pseudomonas sp. 35 E 8]|uniref:hypothetical protein n=1 Tax=Pseudomonas TaxID=286 RepID=UPI0008129C6F|nr:hypothetical protein [Pseudomonas sp. 35 E 8]
MSTKGISLLTGLLCVWAGRAAQTVGSVVEPGCATNAHRGTVMASNGCAESRRDRRLDVCNMA